jgi:hypothetical protein
MSAWALDTQARTVESSACHGRIDGSVDGLADERLDLLLMKLVLRRCFLVHCVEDRAAFIRKLVHDQLAISLRRRTESGLQIG